MCAKMKMHEWLVQSHLPTNQEEEEPQTLNLERRKLEEIIIAEVSARELLWNQKCNIVKRDKRTVQQLWQQVADATNDECSAEEVKRKWKNLRDRYMKIISLEKLPSGSASKPSRRKWQHYDSMSFLRDTYLEKEIVSNITSRDEDPDDVEIQVNGEVNSNAVDASREVKRKRESNDCEQDVMKQIAEACRSHDQHCHC